MGPPVSDAEAGRCPPFLLPVDGAPGHHSVAVFRTTEERVGETDDLAAPRLPGRADSPARRGRPVGRRRSLPLRERPVGSPCSTGRRAVSGAVLPFGLPAFGLPNRRSVAVFRRPEGESASPTTARCRAGRGPAKRGDSGRPAAVSFPSASGRGRRFRSDGGLLPARCSPSDYRRSVFRSPFGRLAPQARRRVGETGDLATPRADRVAGEAAFLRSAAGDSFRSESDARVRGLDRMAGCPGAVLPVGLPVARSSGLYRSRCSEGPKESRRARRPRDAAPAGAPVMRRDSGRPPAVGSGARAASGFGGSIGLRAAAAAVLTFRLVPAVNGSLFGRGFGATTGREDGRHSRRAGPRSASLRRPPGKPLPSGSWCFADPSAGGGERERYRRQSVRFGRIARIGVSAAPRRERTPPIFRGGCRTWLTATARRRLNSRTRISSR